MSWIEKLPVEDYTAIKPWLWALHKKNPNAVPLWAWLTPVLMTPLFLFLFLRLNGMAQPSMPALLVDWLLYAFVSLASGLFVLPLIPLIRLYVYGAAKNKTMPRIGIWHERIVKGGFMSFSHMLAAMLTAVVFLGWSGRGWSRDPAQIWQWTWTLAVAGLPGLIPGFFVMIAKIKLVTMTRARKRRETEAALSIES